MDTPAGRGQEGSGNPGGPGRAGVPRGKAGRITVNVNHATQAAIDRVVEREGITATEALRRLVAYGDFVYEAARIRGDQVLVRSGDTTVRIPWI